MLQYLFQSGNDKYRLLSDYFVFHIYKSNEPDYCKQYTGDGKYVIAGVECL